MITADSGNGGPPSSSITGHASGRVLLVEPGGPVGEVDLHGLELDPLLGEDDPDPRDIGTARGVVERDHGCTPITVAICSYSSWAGGSSAGEAAVRATSRTLPRVGAGQPPDDRRVRAERVGVARRQRPVVLGNGLVLVDVGAPVEEVVAHDGATLDAERDRDTAGRVRELLRQRLQPFGVGVGRVRAHAHPVPFDLDVRLEPQKLRRRPA